MATINVVVVEGNLVKSAELARWSDGTPYMRFTIANNEYYKKENGEYESIPSFIDCQCKGKYAESMSKHLLKGRRVSVYGRLKQQRWTDDNGNKHSALVIKVSEISLSPFGTNNFKPSTEQSYAPEYGDTYESTDYDPGMFDGASEDVPF